MLDVHTGDIHRVEIACRSKFHVRVPAFPDALSRLEAIRLAFDGWLKERALAEVLRLGRAHEITLGVLAVDYRLTDTRTRWGSLGRDGVVRVHWRLIQAPAAALDYVVAHEVSHLVHRHHGPEFWQVVGKALPDWHERRDMVERWEQEHRAV